MKGLVFLGRSLQDLMEFAPDVRRLAGIELRKVQRGRQPLDWKPLVIVGPGVCEIRVHSRGEWRIIYVARFSEAVYVLHCFHKKFQRAPLKDIELAQKRYREIPEL